MAGENDTDQDATQSGGAGTQSGSSGSDGSTTGTTSDGNTDSKAQSGQEETVSRSEFDALMKRMQAADQNRSKAEQELQALRDKDLPEAEKLKRDFSALQEENTQLKAKLESTILNNAFLSNSTYKWKDADAALKLADLSGVTIDSDGKVHGLEAALKDLAAKKKYLLEESSEDDKQKQTGGAPSMGGGGTNRDTGSSRKSLTKTFPALGRRS